MIDVLERQGVYNDTLIWLTSDNGEYLPQQALRCWFQNFNQQGNNDNQSGPSCKNMEKFCGYVGQNEKQHRS